jgi:hypothetical protein
VQAGGHWYHSDLLPGFVDRHGAWRSTLASWCIRQALERVRVDYLLAHPPCFLDEPYQLRVCLSYCDTRQHRGTLYRVSGFSLARRNRQGLETWMIALPALSEGEDAAVQRAAAQSPRSRMYRAQRAVQAVQARLW